MMRKISSLLMLLSIFQVQSKEINLQESFFNIKINSLKAVVLDKKTNEPISFAHVFISQTTCGTYTTIEGSFELKCDLDLTKLELLISHIGYEDTIIEIDSEKNIVLLKSESGNIFQIESDKKTIRNLIKGISENQFLPKYGTDFINEIRGWTYSYSRTKPAEYKVDLRSKLKPEDQTTEKRKKMYHKRNINVTEFFIKKLIEKTK